MIENKNETLNKFKAKLTLDLLDFTKIKIMKMMIRTKKKAKIFATKVPFRVICLLLEPTK